MVSVYLLTNLTSYTSRTLSWHLDSLSLYHLNSHYNSSFHHRDQYTFLSRLEGIACVVGQQECVMGGEQDESGHRAPVDKSC